MAKFGEPPTSLHIPKEIVTLKASRFWRVYFIGGTHPTGWSDFRFFGPTQVRFDHHDAPPALQSKGIFYCAEDPTTCLAEVFQATRTIDRTGRAPWLVGFELDREVQLLSLTGDWPTRAGASMAINSGQRPRARKWSRAIYDAYQTVEGLLYCSSMHANKKAIALYERARSALPKAPLFNRALADPAILKRLNRAASELGYRLV